MTASMAAIGLVPAALSHGIGSESQRPLAIVIIGGLVAATFFTLFVFPLIAEAVYAGYSTRKRENFAGGKCKIVSLSQTGLYGQNTAGGG